MVRIFGCAIVIATLAGVAGADPQPTLDDFFERTRQRDDGFDSCIGYCDGTWLANVLVGAQTANPATDEDRPQLATGARLGLDLGVRGNTADVARTKLWADVLRVNATGEWITDLAWQLTGFKVLGRPRDDVGLHLSFDSVVARRSELSPADVTELQQVPYGSVDTELEVTPMGPRVDKDGSLALPVGVANRLRWSLAGGPLERRTAVSGALALRAFAKGMRKHAQLDVLRAKYTTWEVAGGTAAATTISAGYQRLPHGLDTLPLWALLGYQWAGDREGTVVQLGMDLPLETAYGELAIAPMFERHFELDPATATFLRVTAGKLAVRHRLGFVRWGISYEAAAIEDHLRLQAITPELAVAFRGLELGLAYRFTILRDAMDEPTARRAAMPRDRFTIALDRRF